MPTETEMRHREVLAASVARVPTMLQALASTPLSWTQRPLFAYLELVIVFNTIPNPGRTFNFTITFPQETDNPGSAQRQANKWAYI